LLGIEPDGVPFLYVFIEFMKEHSEQNAVLIGLTGGIGSGKSTVAELFRTAGFTVLSADDVATALMATHAEVRAALEVAFGAMVFGEDGAVNKVYLSERVFGHTPEHQRSLHKLNTIVHPYVLDELLSQAEDLALKGELCIIIEIPLLYEIGLEDAFDYVILVLASDAVRIERVMKRSNLPEEQIRARMKEQVSPDQIKGYADFVIDNSAGVEKLHQAVGFLVEILPHLPPVVDDGDDSLLTEDENSN